MSGQSHCLFVRMFGISLAYILVDMEAGAVLPLSPLDTDPALRHLGYPDAAVGVSYHSDVDPNPYIPTHTRVGLLPLSGEVAG